MLYESGKILKINNESRKYFKPPVSWCKVEEGIMSCKLGMLRAGINYVSNLLNWISNANFITDRAVRVDVRNGAIS